MLNQSSHIAPTNIMPLRKPPFDRTETIGVLLLHGLTGTPSEMRPLAKYLTKQGFQISCPLLPGHGKGHKELLKTRWQDWLEGAREAYKELNESCDHVFIVGLSMGCVLATLLAAENPDVKGLCILSMDMGIPSKATTRMRFFLPLLPIAMKIPILRNYLYWTERPPYGLKDERLQRMITRSIEAAKKGETQEFGLFRTYLRSMHEMHLMIRELRRKAFAVRCPARILHSSEDTILGSENAIEIFNILGSADKSLEFIDGCDHVMTVDLKKNEVAQYVGDFIHQVCPAQPQAKVARVSG